MNSTIHFFACTNVPQQVSFYQSNFAPLAHTVRLSGYPHPALEAILGAVLQEAEAQNTPVQVLHHCLDHSIQGVILPERSAGVYGFDLYDTEELSILTNLFYEETIQVRAELDAAREAFASARLLHDQQETVYIANTDFAAVDQLLDRTITMLFGEAETGSAGSEVHRFFGAATAGGNINYIPEVTADLAKRYFIKGRAGTGKSTFLKKIAAAARERGFAVETYHCSLDPNSLDLVAVRELGFCVFDSTAPHEYFPSRDGDEIIDIYKTCVTPGTDEQYKDQLDALQSGYNELVRKGVAKLQAVKAASDRLDAKLPSFNDRQLKAVTDRVLGQLFAQEA